MQNVLDALRRDGDSSNTIIGIIILIMLLVFVGPDVLPELLANTFPFLDKGVPCNYLRTAQDSATHQSLIGRAAIDPLILQVEYDPLPQTEGSTWTVRIIVTNNSIGTVPIVYNENQVLVGDEVSSSGLGLVFSPPVTIPMDANRDGVSDSRPQNLTTFPDANIRLLGPLQRCVHRVIFRTAAQLSAIQPGMTVQAYYRITNAGTNPEGASFPDQGLDILSPGTPGGVVRSEAVVIENTGN